jgi:hypothetical protein
MCHLPLFLKPRILEVGFAFWVTGRLTCIDALASNFNQNHSLLDFYNQLIPLGFMGFFFFVFFIPAMNSTPWQLNRRFKAACEIKRDRLRLS